MKNYWKNEGREIWVKCRVVERRRLEEKVREEAALLERNRQLNRPK